MLKDEADIFLVELGAPFGVELVNGIFEQVILAAPRGVEHPQNTQQSGFARAGGAHDGDELAFLNVHIDAAQDEILRRADGVPLLEVGEFDHCNFKSSGVLASGWLEMKRVKDKS